MQSSTRRAVRVAARLVLGGVLKVNNTPIARSFPVPTLQGTDRKNFRSLADALR